VELSEVVLEAALSRVEAMIKDKAAKMVGMVGMIEMIGMIGMISDKYESTVSGQILFLRALA